MFRCAIEKKDCWAFHSMDIMCQQYNNKIQELEQKISDMVIPVQCYECKQSVHMNNKKLVICTKFKEMRPIDFWCKYGVKENES